MGKWIVDDQAVEDLKRRKSDLEQQLKSVTEELETVNSALGVLDQFLVPDGGATWYRDSVQKGRGKKGFTIMRILREADTLMTPQEVKDWLHGVGATEEIWGKKFEKVNYTLKELLRQKRVLREDGRYGIAAPTREGFFKLE